MHNHLTLGRNITALAAAALAFVVAAPMALAAGSVTPKLIGNPAAGKAPFKANCGTCHALAAAGTAGSIGPSLTKPALTEAVVIKAITKGGASVMTGSQVAKYPVTMVAYKSVLTAAQINNIAAYIYVSTHK